jgi:hypothetical protein
MSTSSIFAKEKETLLRGKNGVHFSSEVLDYRKDFFNKIEKNGFTKLTAKIGSRRITTNSVDYFRKNNEKIRLTISFYPVSLDDKGEIFCEHGGFNANNIPKYFLPHHVVYHSPNKEIGIIQGVRYD